MLCCVFMVGKQFLNPLRNHGTKLSVAKTKTGSKIREIARHRFQSIIASCFCKLIECFSSSFAFSTGAVHLFRLGMT